MKPHTCDSGALPELAGRPLDDLTYQLLRDWLERRPSTADAARQPLNTRAEDHPAQAGPQPRPSKA
jgi:hypothetical protein